VFVALSVKKAPERATGVRNCLCIGRRQLGQHIKSWSNGQTEGQITRLKVVKRQMYGRGKIDLLQARLIGDRMTVARHDLQQYCVRADQHHGGGANTYIAAVIASECSPNIGGARMALCGRSPSMRKGGWMVRTRPCVGCVSSHTVSFASTCGSANASST